MQIMRRHKKSTGLMCMFSLILVADLVRLELHAQAQLLAKVFSIASPIEARVDECHMLTPWARDTASYNIIAA